ncbi:glycosyltransferase [Citricoccus sp. NPDC079358]|uniref:glycosyltransferase n=1 Tax=Citricoccus sp. NPDC079358 TaxID=3154653 RepID=UPI003450E62F
MTAPAMDHVLLTRFNVPTPGRESLIRAQDGWLRDRIVLFEKYCLPSVLAQTTPDFEWIIYFDPESPRWFTDWVDGWCTDRRFHAIYRASISREELLSDVRSVTGGRARTLLTTNLDNDDGLATDFVERLQAAVTGQRREALYLTSGIVLQDTAAYLRHDPVNAFCSVAEPWNDPVMAWADWHNRLGRAMPVVQVGGGPGWLQVVHGRNVSNTVHGRPTHPHEHACRFPAALTGLPPVHPSHLLLDAVLRRPLRVARSTLRHGTKTMALVLLGPDGFTQAKDTAATTVTRFRGWAGGAAGTVHAPSHRHPEASVPDATQ